MEQRTKVGEFPLGRDKKGERRRRGETVKEEVGGEVEKDCTAPAMVLKIFAD